MDYISPMPLFPRSRKTLMIYITFRNCKVALKKCKYLFTHLMFYFHEVQSIARTPFLRT